jgi:predicted transcriptional regulator
MGLQIGKSPITTFEQHSIRYGIVVIRKENLCNPTRRQHLLMKDGLLLTVYVNFFVSTSVQNEKVNKLF